MAAWDPIQHNWNELVEKMINVNTLLDHLCEKHVIAAVDRDAIKGEKDPLEKVRKLLSLIQKHQKEAAFQKSLRQTGNKSLADILGSGIECTSLGTSLGTKHREPTKDTPLLLGPSLGSGITLATLRGCAYNAKMNELYIASVENGQVFVCNSQGQNPGVFYKTSSPCDVAASEDGDRVYVIAGVFTTVLHILTWKGELRKTVDSVPGGKLGGDKLGACEAVACHKQNIVVLSGKHGVVLLTRDGDFVRKWKLKDMVGRGMAVDDDGQVYITDSKTGAVTVFSLEGKVLETFGEVKKNPWSTVKENLLQGVVKNPWSPGICVDNDGNVYVSRFEANRVDVYDRERTLVASFGEKGNEAGQFDGPCGLCLLGHGKLVVTDADNNRIQIFKVFD